MKSQMNNFPAIPAGWSTLYKLGSVSALLLVVIIIVQGVIFGIAPQPLDSTALDWFMLFQKDKLIGLLDFELLMVVYVIISLPLTLTLYILLRHVNPTWISIYLVLSLVGVMCFIAARPALEMLSLYNGYTSAATETEKAMFLSAGQELVARFNGTAFHISYILGSITGLILSLVMLQTNLFGKATAYVRIASSLCDYGLYVPVVGIYLSMLSVLFLFVWNILIARKLLQLAKNTVHEPSNQMDGALLAMPERPN